MRKTLSILLAAALATVAGAAFAETPKSGANVGTLSCRVAGGMGFVFGSSRTLDCLFTRTDGGNWSSFADGQTIHVNGGLVHP